MRTLSAVCLALLTGLPLAAGDSWPAIPPAVWAMKASDLPGGRGAIVLSRRISFQRLGMEVVERIRVCSEAGKAAATCPILSEDGEISGRTVLPDGREVPFRNGRDLLRQEIKLGSRASFATLRMVPPGVTSDCVVDIRTLRPMHWTTRGTWELQGPFPVADLVVERDGGGLRLRVDPGAHAARHTEERDGQFHRFRDLPPLEDVPFTLHRLLGIPMARLNIWSWSPQGWVASCLDLERRMSRGASWKALSAALRQNLPEGRRAAAFELHQRLNGRIRNFDAPTAAERAATPKGEPADGEEADRREDPQVVEHVDLEAIARKGRARQWEMPWILHALLGDAAIPHTLAGAFNREHVALDGEAQVVEGPLALLVGVREEGKGTLWLDAGRRFAAPGTLDPRVEGTQAIEMVPGPEGWKWGPVPLPLTPALGHRRQDAYRMALEDEGASFDLDTRFMGHPEREQRVTFLSLEAKEQDRLLRESLEDRGRGRGLTVAEAHVEGATDPRQDVAWKVRGRLEAEAGRRRAVDPFPLSPPALDLPATLPETRELPIVLPYPRVFTATCDLQLPEGWTCPPVAPFARANAFGRVVFKVTPAKGGVKVERMVLLEKAAAPATDWAAFRTFLGWIREVQAMTVTLERS